ncbi:MAG: hypothetical protein M1833_001875 [Piccolia ochrophora]|nr:MAG: hypothetical protein M1833_001875 [Piccolia ochrophora]
MALSTVASPATPATPPTGTWRHPKFDEITRRQNAATFTDRNLTRLLWNGASLGGTWALAHMLHAGAEQFELFGLLSEYAKYPVLALRFLLVFNIFMALLPLIRPKDDLDDIPLTPSQRALLGLGSSASPATPGVQYSTPPRYPRSSSPRNNTPSSRSTSYSASPLSGRASPSFGRGLGASPFSPAASPLLQKAIGGGNRELSRRHSVGTPSPLGAMTGGGAASLVGLPSTPSPSSGKGPSVGLNSRWLYDRNRAGPGAGKVF